MEEQAADRPVLTIATSRRWRASMILSGVSKTTILVLPLYVVGALGQGVGVAATAVAAFTFGAMIANLLLWGRLADRTSYPRALAAVGAFLYGLALIGAGLFPEFAGIIGLAVLLGAFSVAADGALVRLAAGQLPPLERTAAVLGYARRLEVGALFGLFGLAVALPLLDQYIDQSTALRVGMTAIGVAAIAQAGLSAWVSGTPARAPNTVAGLAGDGLYVVWASVAGTLRTVRWGEGSRGSGPGSAALPDALKLMLTNLAILYMGFALHGSVFAVYLSSEAGLSAGFVLGLFTVGAFLANVTILRVNSWLTVVPPVQVQAGVGVVRVVLFAGFAALAFASGAAWSIVLVLVLFLVSQVSWGAIIPANTARVTDLAPNSRRAEVMSYYNAALSAGLVMGALAAGPLAAIDYAFAFGAAAVATALSVVLLLRW